ncbi:hypothetical protein NFI96_015431 [Prochilodus magdalenae]|nr:hypothetical protein NFI96_015431 [Prochilodus magdalenae]
MQQWGRTSACPASYQRKKYTLSSWSGIKVEKQAMKSLRS